VLVSVTVCAGVVFSAWVAKVRLVAQPNGRSWICPVPVAQCSVGLVLSLSVSWQFVGRFSPHHGGLETHTQQCRLFSVAQKGMLPLHEWSPCKSALALRPGLPFTNGA